MGTKPAEIDARAPAAAPPEPGGVTENRFANRGRSKLERYEEWRDLMSETMEIAPPDALKPTEYLIEARRFGLPGMMLTSSVFPEMRMVRTPGHVRRDQIDHYVLNFNATGATNADLGGRQVQVLPMQPAIWDMAQPADTAWTAGAARALFIRRDTLDALLPRPLDLHGVLPRGAAAAILVEHLLMLEQHLPRFSAAEVQGLTTATLQLLGASLAPSIASLGLARPTIEFGLTRLIRKHIEEQLQSNELSADSLCKKFQLSRSALYRLFEPLGGVARYIRERRLARCHAILSKPGPRQYIERVAYEHGFGSASQFSRAFFEQFGYSPREARMHPAPQREQSSGREMVNENFRIVLEEIGRV